jgi:anaerobic ribonucleoside-triphosphate reductase activating protein
MTRAPRATRATRATLAGDPPEAALRLAARPERLSVVHHSGPGLRLVLWVQGCSLRCTRRCINPALLDPAGGFQVAAAELARALLAKAGDYPDAEGVTVLGGEPFDQAAGLAAALAPVRAAGLSTMVYSGHRLEDLERSADPGVGRLLALCDLLVDGPFVDALYDPRLVWRGSSNQRLLRLTGRYTEADLAAAMARQGRSLWVSQAPAGDVQVSGAQSPAVAGTLRRTASLLLRSGS